MRNASGIAFAIALSACAPLPPREPALSDVVDAERAFARLADEIGVRAAFTATFADDAVWMVPAPTTLREAFAARPAPADPRAASLAWHPAIAGIAASGELGFTSGPSTQSMRDGSRPPAHGIYFSVWKREASGRWRVALDVGVRAPSPVDDAALRPSPQVRVAPSHARGDTVAAVLARERAGTWNAAVLSESLAADARLLRNDAPVARGPAEIVEALGGAPFMLEPQGGAMAQSGDLAYSYGRVRAAGHDGHYVHLWTRDQQGAWRIAIAVRP